MLRIQAFIALLILGSNAWADTEPTLELPPPSSAEDVVTPAELPFVEVPAPKRITETIKDQLQKAPPVLRDSKIDVHPRSVYFFEEQMDGKEKEAWAGGGWLEYQSGWLFDRLAGATTVYTSQPFYAPEDGEGTLLLEPGQDGFTVLGQAYGRIKIYDVNEFRFFRQTYNTPYLNKNDSRMVPNTFEGYSFRGMIGDEKTTGSLKYVGGYITKIKERNEDQFVWMSRDAGADVERGTTMAGVLYSRGTWSVGAYEYNTADVVNIFYVEAIRKWKLSNYWGFAMSAQISDQQSTGDNLLTGSPFHTGQVGVSLDLSYRNAVLTTAFTSTDNDRDMINPWSSYPGYTSSQVRDFNRAGEDAYMVKLSYDFKRFVPGLTSYMLYTIGTGRKDAAMGRSLPDENEFDADVQYRFQTKWLDALSLRFRYGTVEDSEGGRIHQVRGYLNYDLPLL